MIIGLSGVAGSGKSTVARYLAQHYSFSCVAFAAPMKRFCAEVFDFSRDQLYGSSTSRNAPDPRYTRDDGVPLTPRYALQKLGTDWARHCHASVWVDLGLRTARKLMTTPGLDYDDERGFLNVGGYRCRGVAITDCRFKNELEAVRAAGGILWRCTRPGTLAGDMHPSEREQLEVPDGFFDVVTDHSRSLGELHEQIDNIMSHIASTRAAE